MSQVDVAEKARPVVRRATFFDALRSEWVKLWTLRSVLYTLIGTVLLGIGTGSLFSFAAGRSYAGLSAADKAAFDPTSRGVAGYVVAQLIVGFLGVLVVTSEYATGMIRTSMTVVPRRNRLLAAKTLVFLVVALAVGEIVGFASFLCGQSILAHQRVPHAALGDPGVLRAVIGIGLYLAAVGLLGVALGALIRATAGALAIIVTVTLLVPAFIPAFPDSWGRVLGEYWPTMAGRELMAVRPDPHTLAPWPGFGLMCGVFAVVLAAAFVVFRRRDA